ncbi:MAG: hypothetical protein ACI8PZ_007181 [Myxococcota bacterium]|jgi:hypothetical protein
MLTTLLVALLAPEAAACGGFFCNREAPVDQSGETIVFGVDAEAKTVEMHVQVEYMGPSESFAWVIPVQGEPDVFLSHSALFSELPAALPQLYRIDGDDSACTLSTASSAGGGSDPGAGSGTGTGTGTGGPPDDPGVEILDNQLVGAYDVTTLAADDAGVLVDWLQDNGYDVPDALEDVLVPYIAGDMNFLALKMRSGASEGKLSPLGLRYEGTTPAIPIELTSLAASPDMPLFVYVFGEARAVPLNYLHVRINPLAVDYWNNGANYQEAIALAADEAGGQAFTTDAMADTDLLRRRVYDPNQFRPDDLLGDDVAARLVEALGPAGFSLTDEVLSVLRRHVPLFGEFGSDVDAYACPSCYPEVFRGLKVDPQAVVDELVEVEVEARANAELLFTNHAVVTRLRSSMSPVEMTVDPQFGFNADLGPPADLSTLGIYLQCDDQVYSPWEAKQELYYPDMPMMIIPSSDRLRELGVSEFEYVQGVGQPAALLIEQLGESGDGDILVDNRPEIEEAITTEDGFDAFDGSSEAPAGCGCSSAAAPGALAGLPLLLLGLARRR